MSCSKGQGIIPGFFFEFAHHGHTLTGTLAWEVSGDVRSHHLKKSCISIQYNKQKGIGRE